MGFFSNLLGCNTEPHVGDVVTFEETDIQGRSLGIVEREVKEVHHSKIFKDKYVVVETEVTDDGFESVDFDELHDIEYKRKHWLW